MGHRPSTAASGSAARQSTPHRLMHPRGTRRPSTAKPLGASATVPSAYEFEVGDVATEAGAVEAVAGEKTRRARVLDARNDDCSRIVHSADLVARTRGLKRAAVVVPARHPSRVRATRRASKRPRSSVAGGRKVPVAGAVDVHARLAGAARSAVARWLRWAGRCVCGRVSGLAAGLAPNRTISRPGVWLDRCRPVER
jgi:hypothetical protein